MNRNWTAFAAIGIMVVGFAASAQAADIVVVDDEMKTSFFGFWGSASFADQPEQLWDDLVSWSVGGATPSTVDVLLYTYDGTVSGADPNNTDSIGFYNLLRTAGYNVQIDDRANFATRTDYTDVELIVFPNFGYSDAGAPAPDNAIAVSLPFITMEPGHTDDLNIGTGVTVFSGLLNMGLVVDNDHLVTEAYDLFEIILMDQEFAPGVLFEIPTDGIESAGYGRVLIGDVPEPATTALFVLGSGVMGALGVRRRRRMK